MGLPAASTFVLGMDGDTLTTALEDLLAGIKELLGAQAETELTISSGSVTAARAMHTIDTESDAAADDLTNIAISGLGTTTLLLIRAEDAARKVTLKHESGGAGQLSLAQGQDLVLDAITQYVLLWLDTGASPTTCREVARWGFAAAQTVEASTAVAAGPNVLTAAESGKTLTNEGVAAQNYHTLPTARAGLRFTFVVQDANGIRVVAAADDTIRIGASVSPAAGYVESTTVGDVITLLAINAVEWVAVNYVEAWTVSS
jgi:hypothetical protein